MFATSEQRRPTNRGGLYFCGIAVAVLLILCGVNFYQGRAAHGFDDCGNICGLKNDDNPINTTSCKAEDMTSKPITMIGDEVKLPDGTTVYHAECVAECPENRTLIVNRCTNLPKPGYNKTSELVDVDFQVVLYISLKPVIISIIISAIFSFGVLFMFRHAIRQIIWGIHIGLVVIMFLVSIGSIVAYVIDIVTSDNKGKQSGAVNMLIVAGIFGIGGVFQAVVLYLFRKRIELVIQIFKEASKVLDDIVRLLFEPILTFVSLVLSFIFFAIFVFIISNAGALHQYYDERGNFIIATYEQTSFQYVSHVINILVFYWFLNLIFGCQHFIIASTVSQWYFTRDKTKLENPIKRAFSHLLRFHIGTVCLGSILITIVEIILGFLRSINENLEKSSNMFVQCCGLCFRQLLNALEALLEFLLRNAYIVVALEGTSIVPSGKRAVRLLKANLIDVIAINRFGDVVMFFARLFVAAFAGILCYYLVPDVNGKSIALFPAIVTACIAFLIIHCFMTVFEMTVDTIFICFCIDCEENDGSPGQQYYMSPSLMKAMLEMKRLAGGLFEFDDNSHEPLLYHTGQSRGYVNVIESEAT